MKNEKLNISDSDKNDFCKEIEGYLETIFMGRDIRYFDSIESTNKLAKEIASSLDEGTIFLAEEQTLGKGRMGREWISPRGKGIWMTIVLKPQIEPSKVSRITQIGAAAVYSGLEKIGIRTKIKWPNDILINKKKVGGLLTEMSGDLNRVEYVIMGIGLNVNLDREDFPDILKDKATSIKIEKGKKINRQKVIGSILNEFENYYMNFKEDEDLEGVIDILRSNSILIGNEIKLIDGSKEEKGIALDINPDGSLLVEFKEGRKSIYSGEVSIRGIDGYI